MHPVPVNATTLSAAVPMATRALSIWNSLAHHIHLLERTEAAYILRFDFLLLVMIDGRPKGELFDGYQSRIRAFKKCEERNGGARYMGVVRGLTHLMQTLSAMFYVRHHGSQGYLLLEVALQRTKPCQDPEVVIDILAMRLSARTRQILCMKSIRPLECAENRWRPVGRLGGST